MANVTGKYDASIFELDDDELEAVNGGVEIGDVVNCRSSQIQYCAGCGALIHYYQGTITGVRGVLDGQTVYWIKLSCCGRISSIVETSIL